MLPDSISEEELKNGPYLLGVDSDWVSNFTLTKHTYGVRQVSIPTPVRHLKDTDQWLKNGRSTIQDILVQAAIDLGLYAGRPAARIWPAGRLFWAARSPRGPIFG